LQAKAACPILPRQTIANDRIGKTGEFYHWNTIGSSKRMVLGAIQTDVPQ
jgi:hypothetical protein